MDREEREKLLDQFRLQKRRFMSELSSTTDKSVLNAEAKKFFFEELDKLRLGIDDAVDMGLVDMFKEWLDDKLQENFDEEVLAGVSVRGVEGEEEDVLAEGEVKEEVEVTDYESDWSVSQMSEFFENINLPKRDQIKEIFKLVLELIPLEEKIKTSGESLSEATLQLAEVRKKRIVDSVLAVINFVRDPQYVFQLDGLSVPDEVMVQIINHLNNYNLYLKNKYEEEVSGKLPDVERSGKLVKDPESMEDDPDHPQRIPYRNNYLRKFEAYLISDRAEEGVQFLINQADKAISEFATSGSAQSSDVFGGHYLGIYDALKDFDASRSNFKKVRKEEHKNWGGKDDTPENQEFAKRLANKAVEAILFANIVEAAVKYGDKGCLVSNWREISNFYLKETEDSFSMDTFDFFFTGSQSLEDEATAKGIAKGKNKVKKPDDPEIKADDIESGDIRKEQRYGSYRYNKIFTFLMWDLPRLMREAEKELKAPWDLGDSSKHLAKLKELVEDRVKDVLKDPSGDYGISQHKTPDPDLVVKEGFDSAIKKASPRWNSADRDFKFTKDDLEGLLDKDKNKTAEYEHLLEYVHFMGTTLGVGQHLFTNQLARGSTPGGPIKTHQEWMVKTSRLALVNYQCCKGEIPHRLIEGFRFSWTTARSEKDYRGMDKRKDLVVGSIEATMKILQEVGYVRQERVYIGEIGPGSDVDSPIELTYPDLYSFIVRAYDRRVLEGKSVNIPTFVDALDAVDDFVTVAEKVPGGVSDPEKLDKMDPQDLRDAMIVDLEDLIQKKVSPLKANVKWVNWEHIAQYVLVFIQHMYNIYSLCDEGDNGVAILTYDIRRTFATQSFNLHGIARGESWLTKFTGDHSETKFADELDPKNRTRMRGVKRAFDPMFGGEKERSLFAEMEGAEKESLEQERIRRQAEAKAASKEYVPAQRGREMDIRDWILSRVPDYSRSSWSLSFNILDRPYNSTPEGQRSGPKADRDNSLKAIKGPMKAAFGTRGVFNLRNVFSMRNIMNSQWGIFQKELDRISSQSTSPKFMRGMGALLLGTEVDQQKKDPDEDK